MKNKTIVERLRQFTENLDEGFDNYDFRMAAAGNYGASWEETALAIADAIEAEYLPRPRFNDGSVVQIGDKFVYPFCTSADDYDTDTVDEYRVGSDGWCLIIGDHGNYSIDECLRRPDVGATDGDGNPINRGDVVYDNVHGDGYIIDEIVPREPPQFTLVRCARFGDGFERNFLCGAVSRIKPVVGGDGFVINVGDTVYNVLGDQGEVLEIYDNQEFDVIVDWNDGADPVHVPAKYLTHEQPDTQERIDEDALKGLSDYWGCNFECGEDDQDCPALEDGQTPEERYKVKGCFEAKILDLIERERKLCERKADGRA